MTGCLYYFKVFLWW